MTATTTPTDTQLSTSPSDTQSEGTKSRSRGHIGRTVALTDVPMTVMTAAHRSADNLSPDELTRLETIWREGTERWAELSTASNLVTVDETGHAIQFDQPTIVISEVLKLLP
jgi:pimeloyl-ACP methyl ester carboxylesterase